MDILVRRIARKTSYTIGKLYINNKYFCDTLEDTDRGLKDTMTEAGIKMLKVKDKTAIPLGTYPVLWTYSVKFSQYMPLINNVKGFSGIRIHSGNTHKDTSGCILLGYNKEVGKVLDSKNTCKRFYSLLQDSYRKNEKISITIV